LPTFRLNAPVVIRVKVVAGPLWWGGREGGAILTDLWPPRTCILGSAWL